MKNHPNPDPITRKEYFALMRLLQTLEDEGGIPGSHEFDWQVIYNKLNHQCLNANQRNPVDDLMILSKTLKEDSDASYVAMCDDGQKTEALGWEAKIKTGVFGASELQAHKEMARKYGRHQALAEAYALLNAILPPAPKK